MGKPDNLGRCFSLCLKEDFIQFGKIREDAQRFDTPLIVWAYPRGEAIEPKGDRGTVSTRLTMQHEWLTN